MGLSKHTPSIVLTVTTAPSISRMEISAVPPFSHVANNGLIVYWYTSVVLFVGKVVIHFHVQQSGGDRLDHRFI
jgi:hypothetical protein